MLSHVWFPKFQSLDSAEDSLGRESNYRKRAADHRKHGGVTDRASKPGHCKRASGASELLLPGDSTIQVPSASSAEHRLDQMRAHERRQASTEREDHRGSTGNEHRWRERNPTETRGLKHEADCQQSGW